MPETETLEAFAATRATLAIHLSVHVVESVAARLIPFYGPECPAAVVFRASWPEERVIRAALKDIAGETKAAGDIERTALILVGEALNSQSFGESALYSADYQRRFRNRESGLK